MLKKAILSLAFLLTTSNQPNTLSFNEVVRLHVKEMLVQGYAKSLSWDDLNHGHIFVTRGKVDCYSGIDEVLKRTEIVLYHSAEHNYRWEAEGGKTPRSIIGFMDGTIVPAVDFVGRENLINPVRYDIYGTVGINDIVQKLPHLYHGNNVKDNTCIYPGVQNLLFEFHIKENWTPVFGYQNAVYTEY